MWRWEWMRRHDSFVGLRGLYLQYNRSMNAYVYAVLVDGVVRYLGKGTGRRHRDHLYKATRIVKYGPERARRMRAGQFHLRLAESLKAGATITDVILADRLSDGEAYERERMEIAKVCPGQLWNIDLGGHGPTSEGMKAAMASPEIRARISKGTIAGLSDPIVRARRRAAQKASARRPDMIKIRQAAALLKAQNPEYRKNLSAAMASPEVRKKISDAAKRRPVRENFSEIMVAAQKVLYLAERRSEVLRKALADPEIREKMSAGSAARWRDPVYRGKVMASRTAARQAKKAAA